MKFIIKLFPEINVKSYSIRLHFIKILAGNIRNILKELDRITLVVIRYWDHIEVRSKDKSLFKSFIDELMRIPGIYRILAVEEGTWANINSIFEQTLAIYRHQLEGKTFCVRVKRRGKHSFTSQYLESFLGRGLNQHIATARVNLSSPQIIVNLEIKDNRLFLVTESYKGLGGFPIGTQEDVLSLISGGYDSGVSSYMLMRRGCRVHYCFFNFGNTIDEVYVQQIAHYLWYRFGRSHRVRFISIDFELILAEIQEKIENGYIGVVLKRMMIFAASKIAKQYGVQALVTGESIGQVSSQTLTNQRIIDAISNILILRPLIAHDKEHIIDLSKQIGTECFSRKIPEYCGMCSKKPIVKAKKNKIEAEEKKINLKILDKAILEATNIDLCMLSKKEKEEIKEIKSISVISVNDIVLDIRSKDEQENNPLKVDGVKVASLPFYKLHTQFGNLDQSKTWLLYCDQGVMSRLQALYLYRKGFTNVKVYHPDRI